MAEQPTPTDFDIWLGCPMCDTALFPPDDFVAGEPFFEEGREAACPGCGLLCRTDVDDGGPEEPRADVAHSEEYLDAGQGLCDGTCWKGIPKEFIGLPCPWDGCEKVEKSGWKPPAVPKCDHGAEGFAYVAEGHRLECKECKCSAS